MHANPAPREDRKPGQKTKTKWSITAEIILTNKKYNGHLKTQFQRIMLAYKLMVIANVC